MPLIGLHGRLQAGKDTTYERIARMCEGIYRVEQLSFANPLKDSAAALLGITREELERMKVDPGVSISVRVPLDEFGYRYRTVTLTGREYLQRYGTESHRDVFGDDFWVRQAMDKVTQLGTVYVVTDVRFPNEVAAIQDRGGYLAHVIGPEGVAAGGHSSEQALPDDVFDFVIDNTVRDDDFAFLDEQVNVLFGSILPGLIAR